MPVLLYLIPRASSLFAIIMTIESSLLSAFSNAGAWGMTGLVLLWLTRQREKDLDTSRLREETLKNENSALQQKRVDDVTAYAVSLRDVMNEQHDSLTSVALALNGVKSLLEMMREEGYNFRKPSAGPRKDTT